jgi:hypothetical protein
MGAALARFAGRSVRYPHLADRFGPKHQTICIEENSMRSLVSAGVFGVAMMLGSVAIADPASEPSAPPVVATPATQTTSTAAAAAPQADENMVICRERQSATGSRLGASRECHTKHEWDARLNDNQRMVIQQQQTGLSGNPSGH